MADAMRLGASRPCRSCGALIAFYPVRDGKPMPLDVVERSDGNVVLEIDLADTSRTYARVLRKGEVYEGRRFVSHFATCSRAAEHRKPRAGEGVR